jgi:hypothetical protein
MVNDRISVTGLSSCAVVHNVLGNKGDRRGQRLKALAGDRGRLEVGYFHVPTGKSEAGNPAARPSGMPANAP